MNELFATNEPVVISEKIGEEFDLEVFTTVSSGDVSPDSVTIYPDDILTNENYMSGVNLLVDSIDPYSVNEEVPFIDYPIVYASDPDLPDYAVVYECEGVQIVFPSSYADDIIVTDGLLINLGANYTAGAVLSGANVSNYLSSEITIPTYHSSTWYQYMQTYGQPYRIVDRYVNQYGNISSSTRDSVSIEWSGGNAWEGFTFDRAALFIVIAILAIMLIFRKGR